MLDNTITLAVDVLHNETTVDQDYLRYEEQANRSVYIGEDHSLSVRNQLVHTRSFPTQAGNYRGVAKSSFKFSQDVTVPGVDSTTNITAPLIQQISFSIPVGTPTAKVLEMRQRLVAYVNSDAFMDRLTQKLEV